MRLSQMAEKLEDAGNKADLDYISEENGKMLEAYVSYKEKLAKLLQSDDQNDKEMIDDDELSGAYEALEEVIPQMDYDSVEMIVSQVRSYRLPEKDADIFDKLEKLMKKLDWDEMARLIGSR